MIILGTRPEAVKLAPVILEMQCAHSPLRPLVCVTGQHRQMLDQVLEWFGIGHDHDLNLMQPNQTLAEFASRALTGISALVEQTRPDAVLVQGDTTTAMMGALGAFYHRVPVGHVEAGLRTRDRYSPFPEEINRRIAGTIATLHFAPTQRAADALLAEQVESSSVHVVGNTVVDALRLTMERPVELTMDAGVAGRRLVLITAHRRESFGSPFESICQAIRTLADRNEDVEFVYPVHLNPNVRDPVGRHLSGHPRIHLIEPLRYEQFVHLMSRAYIILTDSGGIQEEATVLRKPTLVMRETTERPEAITAGTAMLVGSSQENIIGNAERLLNDSEAYRSMSSGECPFGDGHTSRRIVELTAAELYR
jgi:UDP-N-acetylglucosamine 2-epimerase